jgi:uncharacterized protein
VRYYFKALKEPGVAPDGTPFDLRMFSLIPNHAAIVETGRVGPESIVADSLEVFKAMKNSTAKAIAKTIAPFLAPEADKRALAMALDAVIEADEETETEEQKDEDAANECYGHSAEDWAGMTINDRKAARDAWAKARDKKAKDKLPDNSDHRKDWDDPNAKDSALAMDQLRKSMNEAFAAREAVRSICGVVTMDSAEEIYAFALKELGVKTAGIHPSAFASLFEAHAARRKSASSLAFDSRREHTVASIWLGGRLQ